MTRPSYFTAKGGPLLLYGITFWATKSSNIAQCEWPYMYLTSQRHATKVTSVGPKGNAEEARGPSLVVEVARLRPLVARMCPASHLIIG